jgi:HEAT repeat protein
MRLASVGLLGLVFLTLVPLGHAQDPGQRAWEILKAGRKSRNPKERANAVRALGLLTRNPYAAKLVEESLVDKKPSVRAAAALSLGQIGIRDSIPLLKVALKDREESVVYAASNSLILYGDPSGYDIYLEQLLGERKTGNGPVEDGERLMKDPKAMSLIGLGVAMGFAPYAGYGWAMFQELAKDYQGPILMEAVNKVSPDKEPRSARALLKAASNKKWRVRVAALSALAYQRDPQLLDSVLPYLSDRNHAVRCAAAAAVLQSSVPVAPGTQQSNANP